MGKHSAGTAGCPSFSSPSFPEAAKSKWVPKEVMFWLDPANGKNPKNLRIVLTGGSISWADGDYDWAETSALPPIAGKFPEEPLWVDLRSAGVFERVTSAASRNRDSQTAASEHSASYRVRSARGHQNVLARLALEDSDFGEAVAKLAAPMHGRKVRDLWGEDLRQHIRVRQVTIAAVSILTVATMVSSILATLFGSERNAAVEQARLARKAEQRFRDEASIARSATVIADEQTGVAVGEAKIAATQKSIAENQARRATHQKDIALAQRQLAIAEKSIADERRQIAFRERNEALTQSSERLISTAFRLQLEHRPFAAGAVLLNSLETASSATSNRETS